MRVVTSTPPPELSCSQKSPTASCGGAPLGALPAFAGCDEVPEEEEADAAGPEELGSSESSDGVPEQPARRRPETSKAARGARMGAAILRDPFSGCPSK